MESWGWRGYAWPGFTVKGKAMFQCHDILYLFFPTILGDRCSTYRMAKTKCAALFIMSTLCKERKVKAMSFPLQLDEFSFNEKEVWISRKDMQREQIPQGRQVWCQSYLPSCWWVTVWKFAFDELPNSPISQDMVCYFKWKWRRISQIQVKPLCQHFPPLLLSFSAL